MHQYIQWSKYLNRYQDEQLVSDQYFEVFESIIKIYDMSKKVNKKQYLVTLDDFSYFLTKIYRKLCTSLESCHAQ